MISGYSKWGRYEEALLLASTMHFSSVMLSESTFSSLLSICANSSSLSKGREVHSLVLRSGSERFELVGSALLYLYSSCFVIEEAERVFKELSRSNGLLWNLMIVAYVQCGQMNDALDVLDRMPNQDVVAWTTVISGYSKREDGGEEALLLFQLMRETSDAEPNEFTLDCVLRTCGTLGVLQEGRTIHGLVIKYRLDLDQSVNGALIEFYCNCGAVDDAKHVYSSMVEPSLNASNSLIGGLILKGRTEEAEMIFNSLTEKNSVSYNLMIKAYAMCGHIEDSKHFFENMPERSPASFNTMISVYSRNAELDKALQLFEEIKENRNSVTWNSMLSGYIENCHYAEAFNLYKTMCRLSIPRTRSTFSALLQACSCLGSLQLGQTLHTHLLKTPYKSNIYVGTSLVDMYSKCGSLNDAQKSFSSISSPNVAAWTALINGYAHHRLGSEAIFLFQEMLEKGVNPNGATFVGVLAACGHCCLIHKGLEFFHLMEKYNIVPSLEHYAGVVNLLGRAGYLKEAEEFIRNMTIEPDGVVWGALLSACWFWADMEATERAAKEMFSVDQNTVSAYVILSNIYALSGKWREKRRVRKQLRGLAVKKNPGRSWIEVIGGVHVFSVEDRTHPHCNMIYTVLENLSANSDRTVSL